MNSPKVLPCVALIAALVACGGDKKETAGAAGTAAPPPAAGAGGGKPSVSKATDDVATGNRTDMYLDRYRFGIAADADGIVVRETSAIPPGSPVFISLYARNAPAGAEMRLAWNDVAKKTPVGEEIVKPVGEKGFVTFHQAKSLPEGSYRAELYIREPGKPEWRDLGGHDFHVGNPK